MPNYRKPELSRDRIMELGNCFAEFAVGKLLLDNECANENLLLEELDDSYNYFLMHIEGTEMLREGEPEILKRNINDLDIYIELEAIKAVQNILVEVEN